MLIFLQKNNVESDTVNDVTPTFIIEPKKAAQPKLSGFHHSVQNFM